MVTERSSQEPNTGTLLLRSFQAFERELLDALAVQGFAIRAKHGAVLANLDPVGTRPSVLARRAGIGKPAIGELIDELESMGYVRRSADPDDRRAKLVVPTSMGADAIVAAADVIARIEARYASELGDQTYQRLRKALLKLAPHTSDDLQPRPPR